MTATTEGGGTDGATPFRAVTEIEFAERSDAELFRLEVARLAKRYWTEVRSFHLERRLD